MSNHDTKNSAKALAIFSDIFLDIFCLAMAAVIKAVETRFSTARARVYKRGEDSCSEQEAAVASERKTRGRRCLNPHRISHDMVEVISAH